MESSLKEEKQLTMMKASIYGKETDTSEMVIRFKIHQSSFQDKEA
jgi:hypothetical protein